MRYDDENLLKRLTRRLKSARGTVFLEFAVMAPFAMSLLLFAYDFTSILYCEQQLEIGARTLSDIEAHMYHGNRKTAKEIEEMQKRGEDTSHVSVVGPGKESKRMVKYYLQRTLGLHTWQDVYVKGEAVPTPGAAQVFEHIHRLLMGEIGGNSPGGIIFKFLMKIIGTFARIATMGTDVYLLEVPRGDRMIRMTCSARVPTFLPRGVYDFWRAPKYVDEKYVGHPKALVVQTRYKLSGEDSTFKSWGWNWTPVLDERFRSYCAMPAHDTAPVAPNTFVRRMRTWMNKWVPDSAWPSDDD